MPATLFGLKLLSCFELPHGRPHWRKRLHLLSPTLMSLECRHLDAPALGGEWVLWIFGPTAGKLLCASVNSCSRWECVSWPGCLCVRFYTIFKVQVWKTGRLWGVFPLAWEQQWTDVSLETWRQSMYPRCVPEVFFHWTYHTQSLLREGFKKNNWISSFYFSCCFQEQTFVMGFFFLCKYL